jgi:phage shock protein E
MRINKSAQYVVALLSISMIAACGGGSSSSEKNLDTRPATNETVAESTTDESNVDAEQEYVLIDVRTVEEFAEGHLEGALNLNVEDGTLEQALAGLDPDASYQIYCRTGRRSALAYQIMTANGFADVKDLGSVAEAAASTGLPVIS